VSDLESIVSASLDAEDELYHLLPELFQDLDEIGVRATRVVELLKNAKLKPGAKVIDLGCGKGTISRAISEQYNLLVTGYDAVPAFIDFAKTKKSRNYPCEFKLADIRKLEVPNSAADLVCFLAMGNILGTLPETILKLRQMIKPGGYMVVDDAFLNNPEAYDPADFEDCYDYPQTIQRLTQHGDEIITELQIDARDDEKWYRESTSRILARAQELADKHPDLADSLLDYGHRQTVDIALLDGPVTGVLWLIRRTD
jgi:ubiquinone/menaquinone biosynthesis C-methylase UbiE